MIDLIPKKLIFGKDISNIKFTEKIVHKTFKKKNEYDHTIYFLELFKNTDYVPKIIDKNRNTLLISMTHCGDLLSLYNLPKNWKEQFYSIKDNFINHNLYILDLRFLPYTPYVINNICTKNNKIYIVDVTMYRKRSKLYINYKINVLVAKISLYLYFINNRFILYFLHIILELYRMLEDFLEILFFRDISLIEEFKNIIGYFC
jgi:hypothetical protein